METETAVEIKRPYRATFAAAKEAASVWSSSRKSDSLFRVVSSDLHLIRKQSPCQSLKMWVVSFCFFPCVSLILMPQSSTSKQCPAVISPIIPIHTGQTASVTTSVLLACVWGLLFLLPWAQKPLMNFIYQQRKWIITKAITFPLDVPAHHWTLWRSIWITADYM